jgi:hypothetical protein
MMTSVSGWLIALCFVHAASMRSQRVMPSRVTIFRAAFQCPAAPQIGCGSAVKPVLLRLERDPAVREAWLNRTGTLIAVVWKAESSSQVQRNFESRLGIACCCSKKQEVTEVKGELRAEALKGFESGNGWYKGAAVDRLSEEEADIIATRLVHRVEAKTALEKNKAERLRYALVDALKKCLTEGNGQEPLSVRQLADDFLDEKEIAILQNAVDSGLRPLPNEE